MRLERHVRGWTRDIRPEFVCDPARDRGNARRLVAVRKVGDAREQVVDPVNRDAPRVSVRTPYRAASGHLAREDVNYVALRGSVRKRLRI